MNMLEREKFEEQYMKSKKDLVQHFEKESLVDFLTQLVVTMSEANGFERFEILAEIKANVEANY